MSERTLAVDISELHRMAERIEALAERADDDGHTSLRERFDEVADDLRAIARDLTVSPASRSL